MKCPACGGDVNPFGRNESQELFNARMQAQMSGWYGSQLGSELMQCGYQQGWGMQNAYRSVGNCEPEPSEPVKPKPLTAWQQFKVLIMKVFP